MKAKIKKPVSIISKLAKAFAHFAEVAAYRHEAVVRILADHDTHTTKLVEHVGTLSAHVERLVREKETLMKMTDEQLRQGIKDALEPDRGFRRYSLDEVRSFIKVSKSTLADEAPYTLLYRELDGWADIFNKDGKVVGQVPGSSMPYFLPMHGPVRV